MNIWKWLALAYAAALFLLLGCAGDDAEQFKQSEQFTQNAPSASIVATEQDEELKLPEVATGDYLVAAIKSRSLLVYPVSLEAKLPVVDIQPTPPLLVDGGAPGLNGTAIAPGNGQVSDRFAVRVAAIASLPNLIMDADGFYHLAYFDRFAAQLVYRTNRSGKWRKFVVRDGVQIYDLNMAIDANGKAHLAFTYDGDDYPHYATNTVQPSVGPGRLMYWQIETIAEETCRRLALALDGQGKPHVVYLDALDDEVNYAVKENGVWQATVVAGKAAYTQPSIAVGAGGNVHIAYIRQIDFPFKGFPSQIDLIYVTNWTGLWTKTSLLNDGKLTNAKIAVDGSGYYHIAAAGYDQYYVTNSGGSGKEIFELDDATSRSCSFVRNADGSMGIAYHDVGEATLKASIYRDAQWASRAVDQDDDVGRNNQMAADADGFLHLLYCDETTGDLIYATNRSGTWQTQVLEKIWEYNDPPRIALAVDEDGYAHAAYSNRMISSALRYATNESGEWSFTSIVASGAATWVQMTVDGDGYHLITYVDAYTNTLKLATDRSGDWSTETISEYDSDQIPHSMAVDSLGYVHVAAMAANSSYETNLTYITDISGDWVETLVTPYVGRNNEDIAIALDKTDGVHISLATSFDPPGDRARLLYYTQDGDGWTEEVVLNQDDANRIGAISLAIDEDGYAHFSICDNYEFYNDLAGDLAYVTDRYGSWQKTTLDTIGNVGGSSALAIIGNKVYISSQGEKAVYLTSFVY